MQLEDIEKQLELIPKVLKIALQFGIGIGALIILIYCGGIGYYPSGLTVGDGLLFVAVALSFGFSYSIVVFFLFCTAIVLTPFWRVLQVIFVHAHKLWLKINKRPGEAESLKFPPLTSDQLLGVALIGIIGVIFILISFFKDFELFIGLVLSVILMAFCYLLLNSVSEKQEDTEVQKETKKKVKLAFILSIYLIPLVVGRFQGNVLDQTMRLIGVRTDNAVVQFQKDYKPFVESSLDTKDRNHYEAKVLFNGFGTSSVLEIEGKRFVVPNSQYFLRYDKSANK
ncbi:hypothetical protein AKN90_02075 [Thiopseudomonas alkaliphila]|uniref:hypothetical protein n=1 Tax=Thiopseudomonas alkaliphila TaxID=1697053 RepID=UPI00069D7D7A|nr:hypothetical protein [Thiopseudomonas alkaliphila]AKX54624.1 hypothetical protein AKN90_02075 [Thiopseudomonas alkaliphila]